MIKTLLFKKAIRSMLDNKRAYIACIVLVTIGIMIYCAMGISSYTLDMSKTVYYDENRMADVFIQAKAIPKSAESVIKRIEGVAEVGLRLKYDARVIIPNNDKIITMRIVSVDVNDEDSINKVSITGNGFYSANDIVVADSFLSIHNLAIGDNLTLIIDGKELNFNICGTGSTPEYVYVIKDAVEVLPDDETFSIGFMPEQSLANLLDKTHVYSDAVLILEDGYVFDDVKTSLEDSLAPYGLTSLVDRKDQLSSNMLDTEITSIQGMAKSIPMVFVIIAMAILYLMIKRVIEQDRMQIGTLKAFGYSNFAIVSHYMFYGLITGLIGGILGATFGYMASGSLMDLYNGFFHLPPVYINVARKFIIQGIGISVGGGIIGAFMGAKGIVKLIPSESMRASAPVVVKNDVLKYIPFLKQILNSSGSMAIRSIMRSKIRSALVVLGVMLSFGMLAFMGSYTSMIDDMLINQFSKVQLYDANIMLKTPATGLSAKESVIGIKGIRIAENLLEIPVKFKILNKEQGAVITGIEADSMLYKVYDNELKSNLQLQTSGITLSSPLADKLSAQIGDILFISSPMIKDDIQVSVTDIVTQNLGMSCYMDINALANLFNLGDSATSVAVKTDDIEYLKDYLKDAKNISIIEDKNKTLEQYNTFLSSYSSLIYIMQIMAMIVAFAIIYNTSTISLSERKREFATLRVLGMQINEVAGILAFEYKVLGLVGILLGFPFTEFLKQTIAKSMDIEMFTFPTYTPPIAYISAIAGCVIAIFISNRSSVKNIRKFDMVEVLKERE